MMLELQLALLLHLIGPEMGMLLVGVTVEIARHIGANTAESLS